MTSKSIESEADYEAALAEIDRLWDAEPGTPESDMFDMLVTLVEAYEKGRYDLPPPDRAAVLEYTPWRILEDEVPGRD